VLSETSISLQWSGCDWLSENSPLGWLAQFELIVEAENEEQALIEALNRIDDGENVDRFDFHTVEE